MPIFSRRLSQPHIGYNPQLESEKKRLDIAVTFLAIMVAVRMSLQEGAYWNFPCNSPCTHLTMYVIPMLDRWIWFWVAYALCMAVYFSQDYFGKYRHGETVREMARRVGNVFLFLYPSLALWVVLSAEGSFLIPSWAQTPFWLLASGALGFILFRSVESVAGFRFLGRNGILSRAIDRLFELARIGMEFEGMKTLYIWRRFRATLTRQPIELTPRPKVRPVVAVLISGFGLVSVVFAWRVLYLSGLSLLYAFSTALWAFLFVSAFLGWHRKRWQNPMGVRVTEET